MKAVECVNSAKSKLSTLKADLSSALSSVEKADNKSHIQCAMTSVDEALAELGKYQD